MKIKSIPEIYIKQDTLPYSTRVLHVSIKYFTSMSGRASKEADVPQRDSTHFLP